MRKRAGVPRWMVAVGVLLLLLVGALLVALRLQSTRGGRAGAGPLLSTQADALISRARSLAVAGEFDAAVAILDAAIVGNARTTDVDLRDRAVMGFERAAIRVASGANPAAASQAAGSASLVRDLLVGSGFGGLARKGDETAIAAVLERLPDGATDPERPQHSLARAQLVLLLGQNARTSIPVTRALLKEPLRAVQIAPALLAAFARARQTASHHRPQLNALLAELPRRELEERLASVVEDPRWDVLARRAAEYWLGEVADLPIGLTAGARERDLLRVAFPAGEIVTAWRRTRDLPPEAALRARFAMALAEIPRVGRMLYSEPPLAKYVQRAPRTEDGALESWLMRHSDARATTGGSAATAARVAEPWMRPFSYLPGLYAGALGVESEFEPILRAMEEDRESRALGHRLLDQIADPALERPVWLASEISGVGIARRWRAVLGVAPEYLDVRVVRLVFAGGRWRIVGDAATAARLVEGETTDFPHSFSRDYVPPADVSFRVPGVSRDRRSVPLHVEALRLSLVRPADALEINTDFRRQLIGGGGDVRSSGVGVRGQNTRYVFSPTISILDATRPDRLRNYMTLVRPVTVEEAPAAEMLDGEDWMLADWRAAIARDLDRMASDAEAAEPSFRFHNTGQHRLQNLCAVCIALPVPEALPALRRLLVEADRWNHALSKDFVLLAALSCGASELVDDERVQFLASAVPDAAAADDPQRSRMVNAEIMIGDEPKIWSRIYMQTSDERTRTLAASAIARVGLSPGIATDLRAALRAGVTPSTPSLVAALGQDDRVRPQTARAALLKEPLLAACVMVAYLGLLCLLVALVVSARRRARRPRLAGAAVVAGLAASSVSVGMAYVDVFPAWPALFLTGVGAWHLGGFAGLRPGRVAALAFAASAVASIAYPLLEGPLTALGVVALVVLTRDLLVLARSENGDAPRRPASSVSPRLVILALLLAFVSVGTLLILPTSTPPLHLALIVAVFALVGWFLGVLAPSIAHLDPDAPRPAVPALFIVLYVLPIVGLSALDVAATHDVVISDFTRKLLVLAAKLSVVWCALRLFDATRVLAFAERSAPRRTPEPVCEAP